MKRRRPPQPESASRGRRRVGAPPLNALEEFSQHSLATWLRTGSDLRAVHSALHFGLEEQRQRVASELAESLRVAASAPFAFEQWARIVDYQFSLAPLSTKGSLSGDGGRFNIGANLNSASFTPFPALYVAEDYDTAFAEKFGRPPSFAAAGLTAVELALRKPVSFTHVRLRGSLESVLDIHDKRALGSFVAIISKFIVPFGAIQHARRFKARSPGLIRDVATLQQQLTDPEWLRAPIEFDLPSNSQVFGRIAAAAGIHAIRYPSSRLEDKHCLVLFPQNWPGSDSFVELSDGSPPGASFTRIDASTAVLG